MKAQARPGDWVSSGFGHMRNFETTKYSRRGATEYQVSSDIIPSQESSGAQMMGESWRVSPGTERPIRDTWTRQVLKYLMEIIAACVNARMRG